MTQCRVRYFVPAVNCSTIHLKLSGEKKAYFSQNWQFKDKISRLFPFKCTVVCLCKWGCLPHQNSVLAGFKSNLKINIKQLVFKSSTINKIQFKNVTIVKDFNGLLFQILLYKFVSFIILTYFPKSCLIFSKYFEMEDECVVTHFK